MKLIVKRDYPQEHMKIIKKSIRKKYGRFEKIKTLMNVRGCTVPGLGEAYLLYLTMDDDESIEEEVIIEDKKIFNVLSAKRFELIEYINSNPPSSLKELARKTGRDYKNIYDDVFALERFFILHVVKQGKEKIPVGKIRTIEIKL